MWNIQRMPFKVAEPHYYNDFFGRVYMYPFHHSSVTDNGKNSPKSLTCNTSLSLYFQLSTKGEIGQGN